MLLKLIHVYAILTLYQTRQRSIIMKKVILDTDIGTDIDDSWCLTYLLAHPECELLGVTTVSGQADERAQMADAICKHMGKNIPVHAGIELPLFTPQRQPFAKQYEAIDKWQHQEHFTNDAVEFLRKTIHENPGEITLLCIGPLTNIGALIATDREIPSLLKGIVLMGGRFFHDIPYLPSAEWNIYCDPYAAKLVYDAPFKSAISIGLDVTRQVAMSKQDIKEKMTADCIRPALDFAHVWFEEGNKTQSLFHDPLAGAIIFDKDICTYEKGVVDVELKSDRVIGTTHFTHDANGTWEVGKTVSAEKFFNNYLDTINNF